MHTFSCPFCHARLRVRDTKWLDRTVACPDCGRPLRLTKDRDGTKARPAEPVQLPSGAKATAAVPPLSPLSPSSPEDGQTPAPKERLERLRERAARWVHFTRRRLASTWPRCKRWLTNPLVVAWLMAGTATVVLVAATVSLHRQSRARKTPAAQTPQAAREQSGSGVAEGKTSGKSEAARTGRPVGPGAASKRRPGVGGPAAEGSGAVRAVEPPAPAAAEAAAATRPGESGLSTPVAGNVAPNATRASGPAGKPAAEVLPASSERPTPSAGSSSSVKTRPPGPGAQTTPPGPTAQTTPLAQTAQTAPPGPTPPPAVVQSAPGGEVRRGGPPLPASGGVSGSPPSAPASPPANSAAPSRPEPSAVPRKTLQQALRQPIRLFQQTEPASFEALLWQVEQMAGVPVTFDPPSLRQEVAERRVTLSLKQTTVGEILRALAERVGLEVRVEAKRVVLVRRAGPGRAARLEQHAGDRLQEPVLPKAAHTER